ncbi:nucleoside recognition domain-containing protein [Paenibacillus piri]|uniref:Sporulation protein n=1 Tax=Paenibacillus piri TaxID=2547395 RepID=A0A4R5KTQ0_9BACL|nr:nucleoside recognition domain-containing protein [Paenibacillus piri]TDF98270.1 sporulation protein [Paenibacillus piri]
MFRLRTISSQQASTLILGCLALLLVISIIVFPDQAFQSSLKGLSVWWKLVFPALLPFLIMTEIARGTGVLHGLGALLEPLLRLLFRLPGVGGWAVALGLTAGNPAGAIAVGGLRRDKLITRDEAERLLTLSHLLSPVFLITVVGVGFLQNAKTGLALTLLHYGSAIVLALLQRFTHVRTVAEPEVVANRRAEARSLPSSAGLFGKCIAAWRNAHAADGRTFGKLLGDSVSRSIQQLMTVGGFMMIFSVLIQAVSLSPVIPYVSRLSAVLGLGSAADAEQLLSSVLPGLFEAHLGAYAMGQSQLLTGSWPYALLSALFAWGGLSTHAQVKSFILGTDIRYAVFLRSRLLHAAAAFVSTGLLWQPLNGWLARSEAPAYLPAQALPAPAAGGWSLGGVNLWSLTGPTLLSFGFIMLLMLCLSVLAAAVVMKRHLSPPAQR